MVGFVPGPVHVSCCPLLGAEHREVGGPHKVRLSGSNPSEQSLAASVWDVDGNGLPHGIHADVHIQTRENSVHRRIQREL